MPLVRTVLVVFLCCFFTQSLLTPVALADDELPRVTDPRLKIELFAEAPQIVTPTGVDVDAAGRVWAIESNTHFPPDGYQGHPTDRILVMEDSDHDGKADKINVFKDGLIHSMSVAVKPVWLDPVLGKRQAIEVYIATRREIFLGIDTDGDLKCDELKRLIHLETSGNYPHNGLAGFAFDASGHMFFGFGENLGADYKIIGSDGTTLSGGGEGGNVYRCLPDGSKLERWATGFWNPHASCFDGAGHLFTLDNDPDSRPPCRLLHIIRGGDYGYRFRNGRKGTHPFTAWNGEIPGTLPMVSGTGEAPSGIVCYESDRLPKDYMGTLLVGSWGDHRIDKFVRKPRGISFESIPEPIVKGDENFRPVGLAIAPDGSIYVTDWVSKEYKLHGKGRIWRLSAKEEWRAQGPTLNDAIHETRVDELAKFLSSPVLNVRRLAARRLAVTAEGRSRLRDLQKTVAPGEDPRRSYEITSAVILNSTSIPVQPSDSGDLSDPFQLSQTIQLLTAQPQEAMMAILKATSLDHSKAAATSPRDGEFRRIAALLAARLKFPQDPSFPQLGLRDPSPSVRRLAVQWVGEEKLTGLRSGIETVLAEQPMTTDLFMACLASLSLLDGTPPSVFEKNPPAQYALAIVNDVNRPSTLRATALRMLAPSQKELDARLLGEMLHSSDPGLRSEAIRTLQLSPIAERADLLRPIAADQNADVNLRADAIAGLVPLNPREKLDEATIALIARIALESSETALRREAIRALRGPTTAANNQSAGDARVSDALKKIAAAVSREPEPIREQLTQSINFAAGSRKSVTPEQILAGIERPKEPSDPSSVEAGRRTFFHIHGAGCYKCHTVSGRGGQVGPDLTVIARTMDRKKLAESILEPSKEISPQFTTWAIETTAGKVLTGMLLGEEVNGDLRLGNNQGEVFFVPFKEIETRVPTRTSIMPEKLHELMTADEFQDLIAFLETLK